MEEWLDELPDGNEIDNDGEELFVHHEINVDKGQEPLRIDKFLTDRIEYITRSRIQNAAHTNAILVNGKAVKSNYKVKPLDNIKIVLPQPVRDTTLLPEKMELDIVWEDENLMVINKPSGLVVHPGISNFSGTLVNGLLYYMSNLPSTGEAYRPGLVHRLDKDTTGIMVVAKTEFSLSHLAKQFFDRTVHRRYHALVWGNVNDEEGTITGNIGRHARLRKKMAVYADDEEGKHAVTHYKVIERLGYVTLIECRLETGRTHQIRVHCQHIGHPVFNDATYGGNRIVKGTIYTKYKQFVENCFALCPRQALHAKTLGFIHPVTGEELFFNSELPDDMSKMLDKWRKYMGARNMQEIIEEDTSDKPIIADEITE